MGDQDLKTIAKCVLSATGALDAVRSRHPLTPSDPTLLPRPSVLFCDFDGPIVDVSQRYYATYRLALARTRRCYRHQGVELPLRVMSKLQFWRLKQVRTPDEEIALRSGLPSHAFETFAQQVHTVVNHPSLLRKDQLQPQLPGALRLLGQQGLKVVLVTLRTEDQVRSLLQRNGLDQQIAAIYGSQHRDAAYANYADLKTALLAEAIADHHIPGTPTLMVGDTEADILAAQRLGIPAIALTCGIRSHAYLKTLQPTAIHANLLVVARRMGSDPHPSQIVA